MLNGEAIVEEFDEEAQLMTNRKNKNFEIKTLTIIDRIKLLTLPIQSIKTKFKDNDASTIIIIIPEAFRMWWYFGFIIYTLIAIFVQTIWGNIDLNNNPVLNRFGANNICIWYDDPPFNYFAASLWLPLVIVALLYLLFDYYRLYDSYIDHNKLSKLFFTLYSIITCYEVFAVIFFLQITATTPKENIYLHTIPFLFLIIALWTMSFKRFMFYWNIGTFKKYPKSYKYLGAFYIFLLLITCIIKLITTTSNLFGAYLWKKKGLEWTANFSGINDKIFTFMVIIAPIIIYFIFTKSCKTVTIVINRTINMS